ncbi:hypothetical protein F4805DRAFT_70736 [Annulohypoxylon moriforme]|nr:hypothetical protein F4805DRAFT_70736 [Annulohypoxylon moriforme]
MGRRNSISLKKMYKGTQEQTSSFHRRCHSVPPLNILSRVREEGHVLGESLHRHISRNSHAIPRYLATFRDSLLPSQSEDEDYDSDEEDRINGVPIIVTGNQGCKFSPTMITNVEREIKEKLERKRQLQKLLAMPEARYLEARTRYFQNRGMDWDTQMWSYLLTTEDEYFEITSQIYGLEYEITNLEAKLSSFIDHKRLLPTSQWNIESGTRTCS